MNALDWPTGQEYSSKKPMINMTGWMKNQLAKLYKALSEPVAATRDALAEKLQSVCKTAGLLYTKMMDNMRYGEDKLKDIVEKEPKEEKQKETAASKEKQQKEEDVDLARQ